jgi:hypothetical protein
MPTGEKPLQRVAIVGTREGTTTYGNECLHLYRRIDPATTAQLAIFDLNALTGVYVKFF